MKRSILGLPILAIAVLVITSAFYKAPVKFTVDTNATTIDWLAKKVTGQHNGKVKVASGELTLDGVNEKGGEFTIDLTAMTIEDLQGGSNEKLLGHLKSDDFFSVAKWKTGRRSTSSSKSIPGWPVCPNAPNTATSASKALNKRAT